MPSKFDYTNTIYVPYMSDHSHAIAAALVAHGFDARVMPRPDEETLAMGLDLCRGKECLPCFITTGDIIRLSHDAEFRPENSQILDGFIMRALSLWSICAAAAICVGREWPRRRDVYFTQQPKQLRWVW